MREHFRNAKKGSRFCYARVERLAAALDNPKILDLVLLGCGITNKPDVLRRLPVNEKWEAIGDVLAKHKAQKASAFHGVHELEQLAALMFRLDLPTSIRTQIWPKMRLESDLLAPIANYFSSSGFEIYKEIPMGKQRIDVLCKKQGNWLRNERFVGIELKNDLAQMKRGLDQMTTFADYAHSIYLACTPEIAASYVNGHLAGKGVQVWDATALNSKLDRVGLGLLIVEGSDVDEILAPRSGTPRNEKIAELTPFLTTKNSIAMNSS